MAPYSKPFTGTEHRAAQWDGAHVDGPALFVGVEQGVAAFGVGQHVDAHFVGHAPTGAKQAALAFVAAVVDALPVNRQQAGQDEIQIIIAAEHLGPGGRMYRVRRAHGRVGRSTHGTADGHRHRPANQHARQFAEELALAPLEHQQHCHGQPDPRGLAAANLAHHHRAAADGDVGGDQPGGHHFRIAGAAVTTAYRGLTVDGHLGRAFGHELRRHRWVLRAKHQVFGLGLCAWRR